MRKFNNKFYSRGDCINTSLGAILLESKMVTAQTGYIVLAVIPRKPQGQYVTWYMDGNKDTTDGCYTFDIDEALRSLTNRN